MTLMTVVGAEAQTATAVPRLVVNVVVDQLRSDYLQAFAPLYGEDGLLRLMEQGRMYTQAEYPFNAPDRASAMACLVQGPVPTRMVLWVPDGSTVSRSVRSIA